MLWLLNFSCLHLIPINILQMEKQSMYPEPQDVIPRLFTWQDKVYCQCNDPSCSGRTRRNGVKLKMTSFRLDIKKKLFTVRVMKDLNRLPRAVVDAPSLEMNKARLDRVLRLLVWWKASPPVVAAGWN